MRTIDRSSMFGIRRSREGSGFVNDGKRRPVSERGAGNARLGAENQNCAGSGTLRFCYGVD
jgi:hypothetical protein